MASIERTEHGTWQARWRDPAGLQRKKNFRRKVDASNFLASLEGAKVRGAYIDPSAGRQTFSSFAQEWAEAQHWKDTTRESWLSHFRRLDPLLGDLPLSAIDRLELQRARQRLSERYAYATAKITSAYAGSIMRAASDTGRIGRDPTRGLRAPKPRAGEPDERVGPDDVPTDAEALAIWQAAPAPFKAAMALGLSGLRVGEVLGMTADRLDLDRRQVVVDRQMQRINHQTVLTTPKAEKVRTIIVAPQVALELRRHLRDHQGAGILFRGGRTAPMLRRDRFYVTAWHPALRGAGLPEGRFTFHALRHYCASSLLANGVDLATVAGHLGNTVETVSRVYAHWLRDRREVPANVLASLFGPPDDEQANGTG